MGKQRSPGEKRLRGLLSGDVARVIRSLHRTVWTQNPGIYATIAKSKEAVIAAIGDMALDDPVAEEKRDQLFARFMGTLPGSAPDKRCCRTQAPRGNPKSRKGFQVTDEQVFAGHSEMAVQCDFCGRTWAVTEDVGYHTPQYRWLVSQ